jgi:hypothetical protein
MVVVMVKVHVLGLYDNRGTQQIIQKRQMLLFPILPHSCSASPSTSHYGLEGRRVLNFLQRRGDREGHGHGHVPGHKVRKGQSQDLSSVFHL